MTTWQPEQNGEALDARPLPPGSRPRIRRLGLDGRPVPMLRGRLHQATAVPFAVAGAVFAARADTTRATVAIAIFTASVVAMLAASAAYHCHSGSFERKLVTRRLDHAMIFVAIGGSQTAYWLLTAPAGTAIAAIVIVWLVAAGGIHYKLNHLTLTTTTGSWLYAVLGWTGVAMIPYLVMSGDPWAFAAVIGGGLIYSGGGVILVRKALDPWPRVFGYHEVWHTFVLLGVAIHGAGIVRLATPLG